MNYNQINWQKNFKLLWIGQTTSIFTSSIIQMAIIWYLIDTTKSAAVLSLATLVGFLPQAIIGYFAGTIVDKFEKKKVMIFSDLFIAFFTFILFIAGFFNLMSIPLVFVVLFFRSIGSAFHTPSLHSLIPLIVPKNLLVKYSGYSKGFESFSDLVSPAVAAVLYAILNLETIILLDIAGAFFAVFMLRFVKVNEIKHDKHGYHFRHEFSSGLKLVRQNKGIMALIIISGLYAMIYFPIGTLFPLIAIAHFNIGIQGSATVEIIFALGSLLGSLLLGYWGVRINKVKAISASIAIYGVSLIIIGLILAKYYLIFFALAFIMGVSIPFYSGVQISIIQIKIQHQYLGRVLSLVSSFSKILMPMGLILSSLFAEKIGINYWFALSGFLAVLLSIYVFFSKSLKECE